MEDNKKGATSTATPTTINKDSENIGNCQLNVEEIDNGGISPADIQNEFTLFTDCDVEGRLASSVFATKSANECHYNTLFI